MIEILSTGAVNSVQDLGRFGYLDIGVGRAGAMDAPALELANRMIGNPAESAGLEIALFPFRLRFLKPCAFAVTGADCPVALAGRILPGWWAANAAEGDALELGLPRSGARAYLAFAGGIAVPSVLGSRSTDLKSGWGGLHGRGLQRGDRLELGGGARLPAVLPAGFGLDPGMLRAATRDHDPITLRVLPSAEYRDFTEGSVTAFFASDWRVTDEANRQGYRLAGPPLSLSHRLELFSHGIMPGTVQIPPSGQPIIQLAEANTCGGYPKIANVIEADLWKLAQASSGTGLRFAEVTRTEAIAALARERADLDRLAAFATLARKADAALAPLAEWQPMQDTKIKTGVSG